MIAFVDAHRAAYGVEPICRLLPIAPSMRLHLTESLRALPRVEAEHPDLFE